MSKVVVENTNNRKHALSISEYRRLYEKSVLEKDIFWGELAKKSLLWDKPFTTVKNTSYNTSDLHINWFDGGTLNVSVNCIDRHLKTKGEKTAILWIGDKPGTFKKISYNQLYKDVCRFANTLKKLGYKKGDRLIIYLPMIVESAIAMLACARLGIIHSVVFAGFSPEALSDRITDCGAEGIITADESRRGGKRILLLENVTEALKDTGSAALVRHVLVVKNSNQKTVLGKKYHWYHSLSADMSQECDPVEMKSNDPLFILYTSGSTGKPKGVVHGSAGYLLYVSYTHRVCFNLQENDIYWCGADVGWITGHSYIVYGPLANGSTTTIYEGVPQYPDCSRIWQEIDNHSISIFYTAPTALRFLISQGDSWLQSSSRKSLRILGVVGEPTNPKVWKWYFEKVGNSSCPISDTWWQTETGGALISPIPFATPLEPGSATLPLPGIEPALVDTDGKEITGPGFGNLVIKDSWPGQMQTVWGNHSRFANTYFSTYPNYYFSGDGAKRDAEGYYTLTGRVDDVLSVSGHRLGTTEIESAMVAHPMVAESAVVGVLDDVKGEKIYAFIITTIDAELNSDLKQDIVDRVIASIGKIAKPDIIQFTPALPKTRSGKIMRRILRCIARGELDALGDVSTLADSSVVQEIIANRIT